jgi:hypothetical protein
MWLLWSFRDCAVQLATTCQSSAATNIIFGLALGYNSCVVPVIMLSATIFASFKLCGVFGVALAALGMLSVSDTLDVPAVLRFTQSSAFHQRCAFRRGTSVRCAVTCSHAGRW